MKIINEIEKYINLNRENKNLILNSLKLNEYKKNDVLISQDGSNDCIGFVESGLLRSYKINEQGDDITCHFFEEGSFFVDLLSFNSSPYSSVSIEAIIDSKVYIFNSETFKKLENSIEDWSCFALKYYQLKSSCLINFHTKIKHCNSKDAYALFGKYYKQTVKESSKKHIASFLGISKYTLSRSRL